MDMEQMKRSRQILQVEAFNSRKKRSGVLSMKKIDHTIHVHSERSKAEMIPGNVLELLRRFGLMKEMDDRERNTFEQIIQDMAASSLFAASLLHTNKYRRTNMKMERKTKRSRRPPNIIRTCGHQGSM
ncbi:hypothetical protein OIU84_021519 [Salix udensis]|uniref:Uncharacterized protein n=1 Tax=Salix udensis TaxID=889485 RepID=A0AAD6PHK5_9ROSI|nr:hypothetical protein OIU84_021519 [Salix udensis]